MKGKRAWIRILEATIAIMLVSGVLLVMSSRSVDRVDISERVYSLQQEVLMDIALDSSLRDAVLKERVDDLNEFADIKIPDAFDFRVIVCGLESTIGCKLNSTDVGITRDKDVFVENIVIAGEHNVYAPKKVSLFIWES